MSTVFETIKDRLPITEVLTAYITLIPSGNQYKAKCPFHNEKTASFSVSPEKGFYYCFGCGAKGDIFNFVEQFEGLDKRGSLKVLAERAGIDISKNNVQTERNDHSYEILEKATNLYQKNLINNKDVNNYLKTRGISNETIKEFRIGYAPDAWRFIIESLDEKDVLSAQNVGLVKILEDNRKYDRFRKRIIFPIADTSGRIIGFSGRLFPDINSDGPKYLNSPETELFQKSKVLYGFDKAKFHIKKNNFAILVEGQFDIVISHQYGFRNTVATSGTAVSDNAIIDTKNNLAVVSRLTSNIFLAFDGDSAGQKALDKAAVVALKLGMNPKVVPLPEGLDPADFILKNGADSWKDLLKISKHFLIHEAVRIRESNYSPHVLVSVIKNRIFPFLRLVISPIEQNLYLEGIIRELNIPKNLIIDEFNLFLKKIPLEIKEEFSEEKDSDFINITSMERFLAIIKIYPDKDFQAHLKELEELKIKENIFSFKEIEEDRMKKIIAIVERENLLLDSSGIEGLMFELKEKIKDDFFNKLLNFYTIQLNEAEQYNDQDKINSILYILQNINISRQPNG